LIFGIAATVALLLPVPEHTYSETMFRILIVSVSRFGNPCVSECVAT